MAKAIYAGSFNPWTYGHQYVLDQAREVFDEVHILVANNPDKSNQLKSLLRCLIIAYSCDIKTKWNSKEAPYFIDNIHIVPYEGLIADYAKVNGITHLIRGLRSTSDFEAEFNMYFANKAINKDLKTWCMMCPHDLLHCSSSYVRATAGTKVSARASTYLAEYALLGNKPLELGVMLDILDSHGYPVTISLDDLSDQLVKDNWGQIKIKLESFYDEEGKLNPKRKIEDIAIFLYGFKEKT